MLKNKGWKRNNVKPERKQRRGFRLCQGGSSQWKESHVVRRWGTCMLEGTGSSARLESSLTAGTYLVSKRSEMLIGLAAGRNCVRFGTAKIR